MITFLALFLLFGATYRLTRLVIVDDITQPIRDRTIVKLPEGSMIKKLFKCFWCISFWIAFAVWGAWQLFPVITLALAIPLTISTIVGFSARQFDY